jgi:hypothetical protein
LINTSVLFKKKGAFMKHIVKKTHFLFIFLFSFAISFALNRTSLSDFNQTDVAKIFKTNCALSGCHGGAYPPLNLSLEKDKFLDSLVDKFSQEIKDLKLVDTINPEKSYLLMKLRGDKNIVGIRMPANSPPLEKEAIRIIEEWIFSLESSEEDRLTREELEQAGQAALHKPAFWGTRVINLPTTRTIGKGKILFRISHRFYSAAKEGYDAFYGLDGPAAILFSLGYGFTDRFSATIARSNRFKEVEISFKWLLFEQKNNSSLPFSGALNFGGSLITDTLPGEKAFQSENMKANIQLSLSHKLNNSVSILVAPSFSSNTNHWEASSNHSLALGIGTRFMFMKETSFLVEWIPVLDGYKADSSGWGIGVERKIGGHVFQIFILNTVGITSSQFTPGGDLMLDDGEFRFGFSIFRWF